MVNPKKEPGFEEPHRQHEKDKINQHDLRDRWSDRMKSKLIRMSRGAQNFWESMPWPRGKQWKATSKRSKK